MSINLLEEALEILERVERNLELFSKTEKNMLMQKLRDLEATLDNSSELDEDSEGDNSDENL